MTTIGSITTVNKTKPRFDVAECSANERSGGGVTAGAREEEWGMGIARTVHSVHEDTHVRLFYIYVHRSQIWERTYYWHLAVLISVFRIFRHDHRHGHSKVVLASNDKAVRRRAHWTRLTKSFSKTTCIVSSFGKRTCTTQWKDNMYILLMS